MVDDSEDTAEMVAQLLRTSGAIVIGATSGEDALRMLAEKEFDAVISDIAMPGMDGFEFLRRLRQLPGRGDLPVLALTGFGRPEDIERARAAAVTQVALLISLISAFGALVLLGKLDLKKAKPSGGLTKRHSLSLIDRL